MFNNNDVIVVGNKPMTKNIGHIVDSFKTIFRCNLGLPRGVNGRKHGSLALCNHLYDRIIKKPISREQFKKNYFLYKEKDIDFFFDNFNRANFDNIFFSKSVRRKQEFNDYLKSIGSNVFLKKDPRTGYTVIFDQLMNGKNVYVCGFSITELEERESWYIKPGKGDSTGFHDSKTEVGILRWLHENGKIDASLCLIDSDKDENLKMTPRIQKLLK